MIHILIADDHAIVRDGIKRLFNTTKDIMFVSEAANAGQVMERIKAGGIDLVLLDMSMPGTCGTEMINRIRMHDARLPILVLSMHSEAQIVRRAIKAGANGYVTKDCAPEDLLSAIRQVASGEGYIAPNLRTQMASEPSSPHAYLSDREYNVFCMLGLGMNLNDIAASYAISHKTVSTYKSRLMKKMQFHNNVDLVHYAIKHHLIN